jgi:hypothetical protein
MQKVPHLVRSLLAIGMLSLAASVTGCASFEDDDDDDNNDKPQARIHQDRLGDEDADNSAD